MSGHAAPLQMQGGLGNGKEDLQVLLQSSPVLLKYSFVVISNRSYYECIFLPCRCGNVSYCWRDGAHTRQRAGTVGAQKSANNLLLGSSFAHKLCTIDTRAGRVEKF